MVCKLRVKRTQTHLSMASLYWLLSATASRSVLSSPVMASPRTPKLAYWPSLRRAWSIVPGA